jgi:hypothetical protein
MRGRRGYPASVEPGGRGRVPEGVLEKIEPSSAQSVSRAPAPRWRSNESAAPAATRSQGSSALGVTRNLFTGTHLW